MRCFIGILYECHSLINVSLSVSQCHAFSPTHTLTHSHSLPSHTQTHTPTHLHSLSHTLTHLHSLSQIHTHTHTFTHPPSLSHTHTHTPRGSYASQASKCCTRLHRQERERSQCGQKRESSICKRDLTKRGEQKRKKIRKIWKKSLWILKHLFIYIFIHRHFSVCSLSFCTIVRGILSYLKHFFWFFDFLIFFLYTGFASCWHWRKLWDKKSIFHGLYCA